MNHPDQKTYALLSALMGLVAIVLALATPSCSNGTPTKENSNLTGQQLTLQKNCDKQRKALKQEFVIQNRIDELKTELQPITTNITNEERSELEKQSHLVTSALTKENERAEAIKRVRDIYNGVAIRVHSDLDHPKSPSESVKLRFENSTFIVKDKNLYGLALRQSYEKPNEHAKVRSVSLLSHPTEKRTLIFVEKKENQDVPLISYVNEILPIGCDTVPTALDEYYFNTLVDGLKM